MNVGIIGAGIHGLTLAWALTQDGHTVTVLEQADLPNRNNASFDQHRLIHDFDSGARGVRPTITQAFEAWRVLARDIGSVYVETGAIRVFTEAAEAERALAGLREAGVAHVLLDRHSFAEALPALRPTAECRAIMTERGGILLADRIATALIRWLAAHGVTLRSHTPVNAIDVDGAAALLASGEIVRVDLLVVAAGAWTAHIVPSLADCVGANRQFVAFFEPPAHLKAAWRRSPIFIGLGGVGDLWGAPPVAGTHLKLASGSLARASSPTDASDCVVRDEDTLALLARYRDHLVQIDSYRLLDTSVCFYSTARDGEPICRAIDDDRRRVWVVAGADGSDYKLAPALALSLASRFRH